MQKLRNTHGRTVVQCTVRGETAKLKANFFSFPYTRTVRGVVSCFVLVAKTPSASVETGVPLTREDRRVSRFSSPPREKKVIDQKKSFLLHLFFCFLMGYYGNFFLDKKGEY